MRSRSIRPTSTPTSTARLFSTTVLNDPAAAIPDFQKFLALAPPDHPMREVVSRRAVRCGRRDRLDHHYCDQPLNRRTAPWPIPPPPRPTRRRSTARRSRPIEARSSLDLDPQLAPNTVNNFVGLARDGYYDGLTFHRVVPEFVIQGGCPEGSGRGGPGYKFADEPVKGEYTLGAVAMANAGPDTNGSQFFICIDDCQRKLTPNYNLFGHVDRRHRRRDQATQVGDVMQTVVVEERDRDS